MNPPTWHFSFGVTFSKSEHPCSLVGEPGGTAGPRKSFGRGATQVPQRAFEHSLCGGSRVDKFQENQITG